MLLQKPTAEGRLFLWQKKRMSLGGVWLPCCINTLTLIDMLSVCHIHLNALCRCGSLSLRLSSCIRVSPTDCKAFCLLCVSVSLSLSETSVCCLVSVTVSGIQPITRWEQGPERAQRPWERLAHPSDTRNLSPLSQRYAHPCRRSDTHTLSLSHALNTNRRGHTHSQTYMHQGWISWKKGPLQLFGCAARGHKVTDKHCGLIKKSADIVTMQMKHNAAPAHFPGSSSPSECNCVPAPQTHFLMHLLCL